MEPMFLGCSKKKRKEKKYACQATPLLKITEHNKKKDIRERNRIGDKKGREEKKLRKSDKSITILCRTESWVESILRCADLLHLRLSLETTSILEL